MKIAGLGFRSTVTPSALQHALTQIETDIDALAVLETKATTAGFHSFAETSDMALLFVPEDEIRDIKTPTQSPRIQSRFGTGSVAEALALAAAYRYGSARLISPRLATADGLATVALAEVQTP
ncbi:cobalamin biosynthesis protein [Epibacterium ulvae]|uniref:cobalamin biosynthesis protein n=1 Tax=Epibacterium ulvae TaxID=1156985 RepID=UPI001BFC6BD4|nr:cobalamin biosynthesis protein [Epibacterium ulvae]MBT8154350.1 cobalamin biosynthesis protein [Epibacterium ulvae]